MENAFQRGTVGAGGHWGSQCKTRPKRMLVRLGSGGGGEDRIEGYLRGERTGLVVWLEVGPWGPCCGTCLKQ